MIEYIQFWVAKTVAEFALFMLIASPLIAIFLFIGLRTACRQWRCKHSSYHETRACDAICNDCGKNLGFIGTVRGDKSL